MLKENDLVSSEEIMTIEQDGPSSVCHLRSAEESFPNRLKTRRPTTSSSKTTENARLGRAVTLSSTDLHKPERGDIWLVSFDPTVGSEIRKTRPAVVISSDAVGRLPVKLVAPLTDWKTYYAANLWHVRVDPDSQNGLTKPSAVDTLQIRGIDLQRCIRKLGKVSSTTLEEIVLSLAAVIEYV